MHLCAGPGIKTVCGAPEERKSRGCSQEEMRGMAQHTVRKRAGMTWHAVPSVVVCT